MWSIARQALLDIRFEPKGQIDNMYYNDDIFSIKAVNKEDWRLITSSSFIDTFDTIHAEISLAQSSRQLLCNYINTDIATARETDSTFQN